MSVDERSRHDLYLKLESTLGEEAATTMMEMLPPVGWADVATKGDLDNLEQRLTDRLTASFRGELLAQTRTIIFALVGTVISLTGVTIAAIRLG